MSKKYKIGDKVEYKDSEGKKVVGEVVGFNGLFNSKILIKCVDVENGESSAKIASMRLKEVLGKAS